MPRNLNLIQVILAGSICAGLISACGDRFGGGFKSRRTTVAEYNDWARKNNKTLIGDPQNQNPTGNPTPADQNSSGDGSRVQLSRTQGTSPFDPKNNPGPAPKKEEVKSAPAPGKGPAAPGPSEDEDKGNQSGPASGPEQVGGKDDQDQGKSKDATPGKEQGGSETKQEEKDKDKNNNKDEGAKQTEADGQVQGKDGKRGEDGKTDAVVAPPAPQTVGAYTKEAWLKYFNELVGGHSPQLKELVKGITIRSAIIGGRTVMSVRAVVLFDLKFHYLGMNPDQVEVKIDAEKVTPIPIELKSSASAKADERVSDNVILSATCLKNDVPCSELGVMLDIKVEEQVVNGEKLSRARAVFKVKTGANASGDTTQTGAEASNMGPDLKSLTEGELSMPPEAGPGLSGGKAPSKTADASTQPEATDEQLMKALRTAFEGVVENQKGALAAKIEADEARDAKDAVKADNEARIAGAAAAAVVEADAQVVSLAEQLKANLKSDKSKAEVAQIVENSSKLVKDADELGKLARAAADAAKQAGTPADSGAKGKEPQEPKPQEPGADTSGSTSIPI